MVAFISPCHKHTCTTKKYDPHATDMPHMPITLCAHEATVSM